MVGTCEVPMPPMMLAMIRPILTFCGPQRDDGRYHHQRAGDLAGLEALAEDRPAEDEHGDRLEVERGDVGRGAQARLQHEKRGDRRAVEERQEPEPGPAGRVRW